MESLRNLRDRYWCYDPVTEELDSPGGQYKRVREWAALQYHVGCGGMLGARPNHDGTLGDAETMTYVCLRCGARISKPPGEPLDPRIGRSKPYARIGDMLLTDEEYERLAARIAVVVASPDSMQRNHEVQDAT